MALVEDIPAGFFGYCMARLDVGWQPVSADDPWGRAKFAMHRSVYWVKDEPEPPPPSAAVAKTWNEPFQICRFDTGRSLMIVYLTERGICTIEQCPHTGYGNMRITDVCVSEHWGTFRVHWGQNCDVLPSF